MARRSSDGYFEYTSADEVRSRAASSQRKLAAKKVTTEPVVVTGRKLVQTWWGQAWVKNLERYADFTNRLSRGRSYVRAGAIIDLKIEPGQILAKVQGSRARPYTVQIAIRPLPETAVRDLAAACSGQLTSLEQLLDGQFPAELAEKFMVPGKGLFPSPREIAMNCSCPDWAVMCKHVAAVLYGVGIRLDEHPELFFTLRQISLDTLLAQALQLNAKATLSNQKESQPSERVLDLDSADLTALFGLEPESAPAETAQSQIAPEPPKRRRGRPRKDSAQ
jgi:uncharacterized Zn finger protein